MIRTYMIHEELRQKIENVLEGAIFQINSQLNDSGLFNLGNQISNLLNMVVCLGKNRGIYVGVRSEYTLKIGTDGELEAYLKISMVEENTYKIHIICWSELMDF